MAEPTETSPLLESQSQIEGSNGTAAQDIPTLLEIESSSIPANDHFKRPIKTINTLILVASIIDLILVIGTHLVSDYGPFNSGTGYSTRQALETLGLFIILALVVALINLYYQLHIILNIVFDILLAWATLYITGVLTGSSWPDYGLCGFPGYREREHPQCPRWKVALQILVGFVDGFGGVVGILLLVLFVLRTIAVFRTRFWQRPWGLYFPTGELTVALTIKVLKQQPPVETQASAGPGVQVTTE